MRPELGCGFATRKPVVKGRLLPPKTGTFVSELESRMRYQSHPFCLAPSYEYSAKIPPLVVKDWW